MHRSDLDTTALNETFKELALAYTEALKADLGEALVAVVLFGSVARGEAGPQSDIDLLVIVSDLPEGRLARHRCLEKADAALEARLRALRQQGILTDFSPLLKTPEEAVHLTPLYFDLLQDGLILYEREGFFSAILERLRASFQRLGARRIRRGKIRYWELKPDYTYGEVFEI
ncbi:MAG: nucleotidyltransferase domain-containing protein [Chloroflexi bacterium]|nr:MAG: nucleotidyltransferase domain-containing protein [Chloroflexota bacterium]